jgi:hypothetical protein
MSPHATTFRAAAVRPELGNHLTGQRTWLRRPFVTTEELGELLVAAPTLCDFPDPILGMIALEHDRAKGNVKLRLPVVGVVPLIGSLDA